ncbi:hypothetical protein V5799_018632 [Amblyomma americanum]|uniref:Uncharacterized protein n=1 Tax=Amblyomma americanum TaxID=6943 RepID=A0AAQ4EYX6_AMBAM
MPYNSLICTLGANMTMRTVSELPEDGLCDFSFYEALEEKHAILSGRGGPHVASFSLVLKAASQHAKTEYGLSFDYDFRNVTQKIIQQRDTRKILTGLWRKKIYHYAFLSLRFYDLDKTKYRSVFHILQDSAHAALKDLPTKNLGYTQFFLSVSLAGRYYKPLKEVGMLEDNGYVTTDPLFVSIAQVHRHPRGRKPMVLSWVGR